MTKYLTLILLGGILASCGVEQQGTREKNIYTMEGYLCKINEDMFIIPDTNITSLKDLNNKYSYRINILKYKQLNNYALDELKKDPIVTYEETSAPYRKIVDTLFHGHVTIYFAKQKLPKSKSQKKSSITFSPDLHETSISKINLNIEKFALDGIVLFIIPTSPSGFRAIDY